MHGRIQTKSVFLIAFLLLCSQLALSQQQADPGLEPLKGLIGKWVGEGTSDVGAGGGYFTFETGLNDRVLVRKNHAEYPATKDRPAVTHDDLMIVYIETATKQLRAFYTDSERNTINYIVTVSADGKTFVFLSDPRDAGPRFRLTYIMTAKDQITLTFETALPDKPDQFRKFIEGRVRKIR